MAFRKEVKPERLIIQSEYSYSRGIAQLRVGFDHGFENKPYTPPPPWAYPHEHRYYEEGYGQGVSRRARRVGAAILDHGEVPVSTSPAWRRK